MRCSRAKFEAAPDAKPNIVSLGPGLGLDYGIIGLNMTCYLQKNIGLFAGAGYGIADIGWNVGVKIRAKKDVSVVDPFFLAMYGTNLAYVDSYNRDQSRMFTGPSIGCGIDLHRRNPRVGYFSLAIILPFISAEGDAMVSHATRSFIYPLDISAGYRFFIR